MVADDDELVTTLLSTIAEHDVDTIRSTAKF